MASDEVQDAEEPRDAEAARRVPLSVRTSPDLRARLVLAASSSGRSLAQEVELRLENSFTLQQSLAALERAMSIAGAFDTGIEDPNTSSLLKDIGRAIVRMEAAQGVKWTDESSDIEAYDLNLKDALGAYKLVHNRRKRPSISDYLLTLSKAET